MFGKEDNTRIECKSIEFVLSYKRKIYKSGHPFGSSTCLISFSEIFGKHRKTPVKKMANFGDTTTGVTGSLSSSKNKGITHNNKINMATPVLFIMKFKKLK
jgi:hypothetical protein